jgi:hypothetical protein
MSILSLAEVSEDGHEKRRLVVAKSLYFDRLLLRPANYNHTSAIGDRSARGYPIST